MHTKNVAAAALFIDMQAFDARIPVVVLLKSCARYVYTYIIPHVGLNPRVYERCSTSA